MLPEADTAARSALQNDSCTPLLGNDYYYSSIDRSPPVVLCLTGAHHVALFTKVDTPSSQGRSDLLPHNVADPRRRVHLQLPVALSQQIFYCGEILFAHA